MAAAVRRLCRVDAQEVKTATRRCEMSATSSAALSVSASRARTQAIEVDATLLAIDRVRKRVPGDGSCMASVRGVVSCRLSVVACRRCVTRLAQFRVVAFGVYGFESLHGLVRRECVAFLWRNRARFEAFCLDFGSFDEYVENMARDSVWGGEIELQAMSLLYR